MRRAVINYWVDVAIGIAFVLSAISGLVFLLPGDPATGILGVEFQTWNSLHTWSSLVLIAGAGAHLALHWQWMVAMTRRTLSSSQSRRAKEPIPEAACGAAAGPVARRRAFLVLGGIATAAAALAITGYRAIFDAIGVEAGQDSALSASTGQDGGVACPFGLVNDPYPGRCRHYRDSNGDGVCDYSVVGSGDTLSTSSGVGVGPEGSRNRRSWAQP